MNIKKMTACIIDGGRIGRREALYLASEECGLIDLMNEAGKIREHFAGNSAHLCAILNARSGGCSQDCAFCSQSAHHECGTDIYPLMKEDKILESALRFRRSGALCFALVTSGLAATEEELDVIVRVIPRIQQETGLNVGAALGVLSRDALQRLKDAGLRYYNHNLETSRRFFPKVCTTHTWESRRRTVIDARSVGLEVCAGGIFGLGESWEDRVDLAMDLCDLGVEGVPINFLNPIEGTALEKNPPLGAEEGLRIIALYRFLIPGAAIRVCGGRPTTLGERQGEMFGAGASGFMTGNYLTTEGELPESDRRMVDEAGMAILYL